MSNIMSYVEDDPGGGDRERTMTAKGREYQMDIRGRERHRVMRRLETKTKDLKEILSGEYETSHVRSQYSRWLSDFELLLETHEVFQSLLDANAKKQDQELFDNQCAKFHQVKYEAESWFLSTPLHQDGDAKSHVSRRTNASNVSSHVSVERVKEEQRKAELLVRQGVLKEKQLLDQEKLKIQQREEELELKTELKVSDAKSKLLEDLERSLALDDILTAEVQNPRSHVDNTINRKTVRVTDNTLNQSVDTSTNILTVSRELNKPKAEITRFHGSALDYTRFKRQFNARVCQNTDSFDERLNYLLQFTSGEAHKIVSGYSNLPAKIGYQAAFEEFEERYGDSELIAQTYVKKALNWPFIKPDDPKALDDFAIFLRECQYAVENVDAARVLEYSDNLRSIVQKLPFYLHDKWRNIVYDNKGKGKTVNFETLVTFIRKEAKKATDPIYGKEMLVIKTAKSASTTGKGYAKPRKTLATVVKDGTSSNSTQSTKLCSFCSGQHALNDCSNITLNTLTDRYSFLKTKGLCFGCLRPGHRKPECRGKLACATCKRLHPTILHVEPRVENRQSQEPSQGSFRSNATRTGAGTALPVVPVRLKAQSSDKFIETYAFLDSGSTATFCSDRILDFLGIEGKQTKINLVTLGEEQTQVTREVRGLEISSLNRENAVKLPTVYTQPSLPISKADVPSEEDIASWPHLRHLALDRIDSEVDLLIGINVPKAMEPWDIIPSENNGPFAIKTIFGWVVNGPMDTGNDGHIAANYIRTTSLEDQLRDHFNTDFSERTIDDKPENSREDKRFMESVAQSIVKSEGHYTMDLPFKSEDVYMPNNKNQARQRLNMLSKRFGKDPKYYDAYKEFMTKIIEKRYAQRVTADDKTEDGKVWYLPHHGVFHLKKNKIRVVFDCAARYGGTSLNEQLLQGPNLTSSLVGTLTRFRQEPVAVMGDIETMFYQVKVSNKHQNFQRFLWWDNSDTSTEPVEYRMNVHLFGATSSPSCASFALRQTTTDLNGHFNSEVVNTVMRNFYVDDCLKSVEAEQTAVTLIKDLQSVLKGGGFHITKWVSNSRKVMMSVPATERAAEVKDLNLDLDKLPVERTLGVNWNAESDVFSFTVDIKDNPHTRRGILSTVSSIYDPLGFLAPMLLNAKSLLQELCQLQISWDDPIPEKYDKKWRQWLEEICELRNFEVDRCFKPQGFGALSSSELHHFADASERGYGIVSYLRMVNSEGKVHCSFVMGKSRVAPLKKVTIPRLELTAATVAARTDKMLKRELDVNTEKSIFWTDSMSVLRYIRNSTSRFHTFVANRLNVIHEGSEPEQWRYVNTKLNPADVASRGMPVDQTQWTKGWIEAPPFLLLSEDKWPNTPEDVHRPVQDDPEVKKAVVSSAKVTQNKSTPTDCLDQLISYHSSWLKLRRSIAWILKIRDELRRRIGGKAEKDEDLGKITSSDLKRAETAVVAYVQRQTFNQEIQTLEKGQSQVKRDSYIRKLDPILQNNVLRVGGRLDKSSMPAEHKHPAILPKGHHLTHLVLLQVHEDLMHAGRNHMLSALRQHYWVVNAPSAIRKLLRKCVTCRKCRSRVGEQKMAALPEDRVTPDEPPFTRVGVDYFGPFEVKLKRSRVKRYGAIFTCLASRAVHIEVAYSLDTDSYINSLRRFISRRGQVQTMRSDNGTNFVGAERELRQAISEWNAQQINDAMLKTNIDWKFNPPAGSHHGGVWERLIRSVRSAMNSTLKEQVLDDEGLQTLLCEIEATLNDRPISRVSDRFDDLEALTPNHLLLLKRKPNLPPGLFCKADNYCRRRWRQVQYMANLFWQRWIREYLPLLQERQKWHEQRTNLKVGDVVLIVDSTAPRNSWPMGVIEETLPDRSGLVRQVKVRTATNKLTRPIDKLCVILEAE